jgi:hypothetical protein
MHETPGVGGTDVHARTLADRLQPLEDEEVRGVVRVLGDDMLLRYRRAAASLRFVRQQENLPATRPFPCVATLVADGYYRGD